MRSLVSRGEPNNVEGRRHSVPVREGVGRRDSRKSCKGYF